MIRIRDDRGRELTFGGAPRRVVSLVPSDTYNIAALGLTSTLVGRTDYCELPAEIRTLRSVGGTKNPRVSVILELSPDLVLANQEENTKSDLETLAVAGVRVLVAFPKRASDGLAHLARLARIFQVERDPAVRELFVRGYNVIREAEARTGPRVPTFCPIWMDPLMTIHEDTFMSNVLFFAGADNVFADRTRKYPLAADLGKVAAVDAGERDTRYPRVTLEEVVAKNPRLVLLPDEPHPFGEDDAAVFREALPDAIVVRTAGKDLSWYGARTIESLPRLTALVKSALDSS